MVRVHCDPPSGFALRGAEGKPLAPENLDNCTLEKLFEGRAEAEAKVEAGEEEMSFS